MGSFVAVSRVGVASFLFLAESFINALTAQELSWANPICSYESGVTRTTEYFLTEPHKADPCSGTDWIVLLLQFAVIHAISWGTRYLLLFPAARLLLGKRATKLRVKKVGQTTIALCFHVTSGYFSYRLFAQHEWIWQNRRWSENLDNRSVSCDVKFYYLLYAARYLSDLLSLPLEPIRSDFWAYAAHHFVSVILVLLSANHGFTRIGSVIMLFMDWADPFMLAAKLFRYFSDNRSDLYQFCADRLFESFAVVFIITRNIMFSFVMWVCLRDFPNATASNVLKAFVVIMALLQSFWLCMIIKAAMYQQGNEGNVDDIRSDDESSEIGDTYVQLPERMLKVKVEPVSAIH